jgi:plastocyanin
VTKNTAALVKVRCNAIVTGGRSERVHSTLNPGQRLKIFADGCELSVLKNKPGKVKVKCLPIAAETVTVAPGGALSFNAATVNINVGETVKWVWSGSGHTVTSGDGTPDNLFCSPNNKNCATAPSSNGGAQYRFTFNAAGTFKYYCRIHPTMEGTVNVAAP